ncbi:hypothetical protein [Bacillus sp. FJAT-44742]|uniref:hypothetical protein n=1 Tax=Bacillus sp. FJAT-44742 TaxID=2014005 RepID=UPI000C232F92|nr:hypothetical protein [Bacillus sp. FJAT-44742]
MVKKCSAWLMMAFAIFALSPLAALGAGDGNGENGAEEVGTFMYTSLSVLSLVTIVFVIVLMFTDNN